MKIGDLVTIKSNTFIWCINLQAVISFPKDTVYKISNTCVPNKDDYFLQRVEVIFDIPGYIPSILELKQEFGPVNQALLSPFDFKSQGTWSFEWNEI